MHRRKQTDSGGCPLLLVPRLAGSQAEKIVGLLQVRIAALESQIATWQTADCPRAHCGRNPYGASRPHLPFTSQKRAVWISLVAMAQFSSPA
jgi:hypothetical protein